MWWGDITYVICSDGTLYVLVYTELSSCNVVSFDIRSNMNKNLVIESLEDTFKQGIIPKMIHIDGGSQYRSHKFKSLMEEYKITHSMLA